MSEEFEDDLFEGDGGFPTHDQIIRAREYLRRHNRIKVGFNPNDQRGARPTHKELIARNFKMSLATVSRVLIAYDLGNEVKHQQSDEKGFAEDYNGIPGATKGRGNPPPGANKVTLTLKDLRLNNKKMIPTMMALLAKENTSSMMAIEENRVRMALNIIIAKRMAASPNLLMLDLKSTAAMVDSLTVASKLSGGSSIDISIPTVGDLKRAAAANALTGHGHDMMKDISPVPKSALAQELDAYRIKKANGGKSS